MERKKKKYKPKQFKELEKKKIKNDFKIILMGGCCVGKTSIFKTLSSGKTVFWSVATIGIDKKTFTLNMENGKEVNFSLFDTSGYKKYFPITASYLKGVDAVILIYSIIDKRSFESLNNIINLLKEVNCFGIPILLLGNRKDLEEKREVTKEQGEKFALENGFIFHESSIEDYEELYSIYYKFAKMVYEKYLKEPNTHIDESNNNKKNLNILMKYISF